MKNFLYRKKRKEKKREMESRSLTGFPVVPLPNLLGTFVPTYLADNQIGDLNWNRSNPPDPSYKRIGCIGDGSCFFHAAVKGLGAIYQLSYQPYQKITEEILVGFENSIGRNNLFDDRIFNPLRTLNNRRPGMQYIIINQIAFQNSMNTFRSVFIQKLREDFANQLQTNQQLRDVVARRLANEIEFQKEALQYNHPELNDVEAMQITFQLIIDDLSSELRSLDSVDARYALLLSDYYNVDIYVIIDREIRDPNSRNTLLSEYYNSAVQGPRNMRLPNDPLGQIPSRPALILIHVNGGHFEIIGKIDSINGIITTNFNSGEPIIRQLYELLLQIRG
jgi:hypothetical protein